MLDENVSFDGVDEICCDIETIEELDLITSFAGTTSISAPLG